jgi:hypothetical protein
VVAECILVAITTYPANWVHFTWWYQGIGFMYSVVGGVLGFESSTFWFLVCSAVLVIGSVLVMSFADCTVFEEAYDTAGPAVYIAGDYTLHWVLPVIALALRRTTGVKLLPRSAAVALLLLYVWQRYGCASQALARGRASLTLVQRAQPVAGIRVQSSGLNYVRAATRVHGGIRWHCYVSIR